MSSTSMPRPRSKHAAKHFSWVEKYLKELRRTGSKIEACTRAGICRDTTWRHRKRSPEFKRREQDIVDRIAVDTGKTHHVRTSCGVPFVRSWRPFKAARDHECCLCGDTIHKGARYWVQKNEKAAYRGGAFVHKYCQECKPHYRKPQ